MNDQAYKLCLLNATDKDLADFFEITVETLNDWKLKFPSFSLSIKEGKEEADMKVGHALFQRAVGYTHKAVEIKVVSKEGKHSGSEVVHVPVEKHYPPEIRAIQFWLMNRRRKEWTASPEVEKECDAPIVWNETKTYKK